MDILIFFLVLFLPLSANADLVIIPVDESSLPYDLSPRNYNNSPRNYDNSVRNYDNSIRNYSNSPRNYKNSPSNYENGSMGKRRLLVDKGGSLYFKRKPFCPQLSEDQQDNGECNCASACF